MTDEENREAEGQGEEEGSGQSSAPVFAPVRPVSRSPLAGVGDAFGGVEEEEDDSEANYRDFLEGEPVTEEDTEDDSVDDENEYEEFVNGTPDDDPDDLGSLGTDEDDAAEGAKDEKEYQDFLFGDGGAMGVGGVGGTGTGAGSKKKYGVSRRKRRGGLGGAEIGQSY